jgi:thiosulfate dehydrogenase (quinone) large subunit
MAMIHKTYVTEAARNNAYTTLEDHPVEIALFNKMGIVTFVWLVVRLYLGFQWAQAGWEKLQNPKWMDGTSLLGFWNGSIAQYGQPHSGVAFDWYTGFLSNLVAAHNQTWFAPLVAYAEFLGGIALMLGLFTGIAALGLAFMNFNFMLAGSAGVNPLYFLLAMLLVMAWKNAGWWGADHFVLPMIGTPWRAGALFNRAQAHKEEFSTR